MNVAESRFKNRQLYIEDYLQMVSFEKNIFEEGILPAMINWLQFSWFLYASP